MLLELFVSLFAKLYDLEIEGHWPFVVLREFRD
jgi:hypothetical protein